MPEPGRNDYVTPLRFARLNFDEALTRDFEDWRRRQARIPSTAEALRQLVARQLRVERSYAALAEATQHV